MAENGKFWKCFLAGYDFNRELSRNLWNNMTRHTLHLHSGP
jgi:hypothetical protein